ncbi:hypothetical protein TWF281_001270 [Arthrobotrys megalospora]
MAARFAFSRQLKELRFHLCQSGAASGSLRSFITKSYPVMKKNNPEIPILIREAQGVPPRVFARYGPSYTLPPNPNTEAIGSAKPARRIGEGNSSRTLRPLRSRD